MPQEPQITGMSSYRRTVFFWGLVLVFLFVLPTMIFYTTGYRLTFKEDAQTLVVTTGGVYVSTQSTDVDVYLDDEQVERPRLFRSAYYIQNIDAGVRRVVVQGEGIQTWVKDLLVEPRIVTEAAAFNLPTVPRLRPVTEFQTATGASVYFSSSTPSTLFSEASSTTAFIVATTSRTLDYVENQEYEFVVSLFGTSIATTTSIFAGFMQDMDRFRFLAPGEEVAITSTTTPDSIEQNDIQLVNRELELYAIWNGQPNDVPYYFCVASSTPASMSDQYGTHVADAVFAQLATTIATSTLVTVDNRICRTEIKLDRLRQDVYLYDFFPGSSDLVLLQLESGLYVTEIDDRAWQNSQLLYQGSEFRTIISNGLIYVELDDQYFEVVTEFEPN